MSSNLPPQFKCSIFQIGKKGKLRIQEGQGGEASEQSLRLPPWCCLKRRGVTREIYLSFGVGGKIDGF